MNSPFDKEGKCLIMFIFTKLIANLFNTIEFLGWLEGQLNYSTYDYL